MSWVNTDILKRAHHCLYLKDAIEDIFKELPMPFLKCLGRHTQNANEFFNSLIWKLCPKTWGSGIDIVQIAVNEATVVFNKGQTGRLNTVKEFGFQLSNNSRSFAAEIDLARIDNAEKKAQSSALEVHEARKQAKLTANEVIQAQKGAVYETGMF